MLARIRLNSPGHPRSHFGETKPPGKMFVKFTYLAADFVRPAFAARRAVTDARPECHVEAQPFEVKPLAQLADPSADVFTVGRVRADKAVPAARVDGLPGGIEQPVVGVRHLEDELSVGVVETKVCCSKFGSGSRDPRI